MKRLRWFTKREHLLAVVIGFVDGILTAVLLAAGRLLGRGGPPDIGVVLRVAVSAFFTAGFVFYVGRYAELRASLVRAEAQLNLAGKAGHLASTKLGQAVFWDAASQAAISGICSFIGALLPMTVGLLAPNAPILIVAFPISMLGVLGAVLGRVVRGSYFFWVLWLLIGGLVMTAIGFELDLV